MDNPLIQTTLNAGVFLESGQLLMLTYCTVSIGTVSLPDLSAEI